MLILVLMASFSLRLWVSCMQRDAEFSEKSWLISDTAVFTNTSIMDRSWDSRLMLPGGMSVDMFHFAVFQTRQINNNPDNTRRESPQQQRALLAWSYYRKAGQWQLQWRVTYER